MTVKPVSQRFWEKVSKGDGCWDWKSCKTVSGYGAFSVGNKMQYAHRYSYEDFVGPIPAGLQLDHLCRNRGCVNPAHLEPVSQKVNLLRGMSPPALNSRKDSCSRGHEYTVENTYRYPDGSRKCRTCRDEYRREYHSRTYQRKIND